MKKSNRVAWTTRAAVVASLTVAGVLGTTIPANAASPAVTAGAGNPMSAPATARSDASTVRLGQQQGGQVSSATTDGAEHSGARSWATILRLAKDAIKKVPSVWNKAVSSAKKGYSTFVKTAWPSIKLIVNVISYSITAWDIWNLFR